MTDAYSNVERTSEIKASLLHTIKQCFKFLLKNPSVELAFLLNLVMWVDQLRSLDIVTPKYGQVNLL